MSSSLTKDNDPVLSLQSIAQVDLSEFDPMIDTSSALLKNIDSFLKFNISCAFAAPLALGIVSAGITHSFGMLILCVVAAVFGGTASLVTPFWLFPGAPKMIEALGNDRSCMLRDRIALLEVSTGGIASASSYVELSKLSNEEASDWIKVLKQSAEKEKIEDVETYYKILKAVQNSLMKENYQSEKEALQRELQEITK